MVTAYLLDLLHAHLFEPYLLELHALIYLVGGPERRASGSAREEGQRGGPVAVH